MFTTRVLARRHADFYALLFILFLWGRDAWFYSGFLHFSVLPTVLPYPSTFAKGLVLVGMALHLRFLDDGNRWAVAATVGIGATLLLCHPVDALFFFVGVGALALTRRPGRRTVHLAVTGLAVAVSGLLALAWPHYPLYDLVFGPSNETYRMGLAHDDRIMYEQVLGRTWPMLIALPFLLRRLLRDRGGPMLPMLGGLLVLYGYGWWSGEWNYGRIFSAVTVVIPLVLADERAEAGETVAAMGRSGRPAARWIQYSTLGLVLVGLFQVRHGFSMLPERVLARLPDSAVPRFLDTAPLSDYSFLSRFVGDGQVVMADRTTSLEVPAFGGRVVGISAPEAFVDMAERNADVGRFHDPASSEQERRDIAAKYDAEFLLLDRRNVDRAPERHQSLLALGPVSHSNDRFILIDLRAPRPAPRV